MRSRPEDDEQLITAAKQGSAEAFGKLYERYCQTIYRYIASHIASQQDAEDLTEEIFLRAWNALPHYNERGLPFSAFLFRSARNSLIDFYRQNRVVQSLGEFDIETSAEDPQEVIHTKLANEDLRAKIAQLREDYQTVLALRFLSGLTPDETAAMMERSVGAVRVLQHRALTALKDLIEQSQHEQPG